MTSFSSVFQWATEPAIICLYLGLIFFAITRRLDRQLKFFSVYIVIASLLEIFGWWATYSPWHSQSTYRYAYWSVQFVLSLLRLLTIAEISRRSLRGYPAVWAFASRLLITVAVILLAWTTSSAIGNVHHFRRFITAGDQRFECMQAILLLLVLAIGAYYHIEIPPLYRLILVGIGIYSAIQVANDQIAFLNTSSVFDYIRRGTFPIALAIWTYAVWRWGSSPDAVPDRISQEKYDQLSPQIHDRLRELNDKLSDLTGKRRR
jgi:hypothetical protein